MPRRRTSPNPILIPPTPAAGPSLRTTPVEPPVSLTLTAVARRWRVDVETARRVLAAAGVAAQRTHATPRYLCRDVFAIERKGALGDGVWRETTAPLRTAAEVAASFGVDVSTVRRYAAAGRVPAIRLGARALRFLPEDAPSSTIEERAP